MEFASFLNQADGIGCGFSQIFSLVLLCFFLVLGLKFLHLKGLKIESCNKNGLEQKKPIILHWSSCDSVNGLSCENCDLLILLHDGLGLTNNRDTSVAAVSETELDEVFDVITLRKMVKRERKRGDCINIELEKERLAAGSAAEEAMAMLLKVRMEKSSVEMEAKQYRRVAEQKQIYDQQVIQSLQWMLMKLDHQEFNGLETN